MPARNVTAAPEKARSPVHSIADWERFSGRGDPEQRYRLYALCSCEACVGTGKTFEAHPRRCPLCRGEGRILSLCATSNASSLGVAIITLAREGTWDDDCPLGILDTDPPEGAPAWLIKPWQASPSARNLSDAGRVLARGRKR